MLLGMLLTLDAVAVAVADAADTAFTLLWYTLSWAGYVKAGRQTDRQACLQAYFIQCPAFSVQTSGLPSASSAFRLPAAFASAFAFSTLDPFSLSRSLSRLLYPGCSLLSSLLSSSIVYRLSSIAYHLSSYPRF